LSISFSVVIQLFTLLVFLVVPYFLPFAGEQRSFSNWVIGRIVVAGAVVVLAKPEARVDIGVVLVRADV
jgi:hypothetical protein